MCRPVKCKNCSKTTWAGCGKHVDEVMKDVAASDRCACSPAEKMQSGGFLSWFRGK